MRLGERGPVPRTGFGAARQGRSEQLPALGPHALEGEARPVRASDPQTGPGSRESAPDQAPRRWVGGGGGGGGGAVVAFDPDADTGTPDDCTESCRPWALSSHWLRALL